MTGQISYTHLAYLNDISLFGQMQLPIFDRNQGEIARSGIAITKPRNREVRERTGADGRARRV